MIFGAGTKEGDAELDVYGLISLSDVSRNLGLKWDRSGHGVLLGSAGYSVVALDALLAAYHDVPGEPDAHRACAWPTSCREESGRWGEVDLEYGGGSDDGSEI